MNNMKQSKYVAVLEEENVPAAYGFLPDRVRGVQGRIPGSAAKNITQ